MACRPYSSPNQRTISTAAIRQASSRGRVDPTVIQWVSSSIRGHAGSASGIPPLISSTISVVVIAPSTAVPHASPSPCR